MKTMPTTASPATATIVSVAIAVRSVASSSASSAASTTWVTPSARLPALNNSANAGRSASSAGRYETDTDTAADTTDDGSGGVQAVDGAVGGQHVGLASRSVDDGGR